VSRDRRSGHEDAKSGYDLTAAESGAKASGKTGSALAE